MTHKLRDYQRTAVLDVVSDLKSNPLLVAPTGAGKTTMGAAIVKAYQSAFKRPVLWVAHRHELLEQARIADAQTVSVQSLCRRPGTDAGLLVFDEAHRTAAKSYQTVIEKHPNALRLGLTATPFRLDGRGLGNSYGRIVTAATTRELVDNHTLIEPTVYVVKPPTMAGVTRRGGDYAAGDAANAANTPEQRACIVGEYMKRLQHCRVLVFACTIEHSKSIVDAFTAAGVKAAHVDGNSPDRAERIDDLRHARISVLSSVDLFTEGFDLPAIDALIIARPTASLAMHLQMTGRVMRRAEGKFMAWVHDHAGNHLRHGPVTRGITYTLEDTEAATKPSEPLGLKLCPECFRMNPANVSHCVECGEAFTAEARTFDIDGSGEMVQLTTHQERAAYWASLEGRGRWQAFKDRFGDYPATVEIDGENVYINPDEADMTIKKLYYEQMIARARDKGYKPHWASHRYRSVFGVWPKGFVTEVRGW